LADTLIFVESPTDLLKINKNILISKNSKIFSFNIYVHKILEEEKIIHEIAENYLDENDKVKIFDSAISHYTWYDRISSTNLELEGVNLLGMLDTAELHQFFINGITFFLIIKRIIEKEKPKKIIVPESRLKIIKSLFDVEIETYTNKSINYLAWDRIEIKFNIGKLPISFHISRNLYAKLKGIFESLICKFFNLWFNFNANKTILLLEFDPSTYNDLLIALSKYNKNILLYNRRRSAVWNLRSIRSIFNSKSKLLNFKKLELQLKTQISSLTNHYAYELKKIWQDENVSELFLLEGLSFWHCIKDQLIDTYDKRIHEYVSLVLVSKYLLNNVNIGCILSLNVVGETEKSILSVNMEKIHSIMLEHGYANWIPQTSRLDVLSMYPLINDKIAVWGETQKKYLIDHRKFEHDKVLTVGSPKHDYVFKIIPKPTNNSKKVILLTLHPITQITGHTDTNSYVRFENLLTKFCITIKKMSDVKVIVKLHPSQDKHNDDIIEFFKKTDPSIPIYHLKPIIDLITTCDALVSVSPEGFDPSTVILDSIILGKPTMNIVLDDNLYDFQYVKDRAVLSISDNSDIESSLHDILFNDEIRNNLVQNGRNHIKNYLSNPGTASEYFARIINEFSENRFIS